MSPASTPKSGVSHAEASAALVALHGSLRQASGGVVVVDGPVGVGKGALLAKVRSELSTDAGLVLFGRAEPGALSPFAALREPAAQAVAFLESIGQVERFMDRHHLALSVLLPMLAPAGPARPQDKAAFFEALRSFFIDLGRLSPVTLIVDSVEEADDDTRDALRFLATHLFGPDVPGGDPAEGFGGVLFLAVSTDEADAKTLVRSLCDEHSARRVTIKGLDRQGLLDYLAAHPKLEHLLAATGGRPDDIDELLEAIPDDVATLVLGRVAQQPPAARALLDALAVYARPASTALLARMVGDEDAAVAQQLAQLMRARLLRRQLRNGELLFSFARSQHRRLISARLTTDARRSAHTAIARALSAHSERHISLPSQLIAHHHLHGATPAEGVSYAIEAAGHLLVTYAYGTAVELLRSALEVANDDARATLLRQLVEAERLRGETRAALHAAQELATFTPGAPDVTRTLAELMAAMGDHTAALSRLGDALRSLDEQPPAALSEADIHEERAALMAAMAESAYASGQLDRASALATEALTSAGLERPALCTRLRNTLGKIAFSRENFREAAARFDQNFTDAQKHGLLDEVVRARINLGLVWQRQGRFERARGELEAALSGARAAGDVTREALALLNLGTLAQRRGQLYRAVEHLRGAHLLLERLELSTELRRVTWNLANLFTALGDEVRARSYLDRSRALAEAAGSKRGLAFVLLTEGDLASDAGRAGAAVALHQRALDAFKDLGETARVAEMRLKLGWTALSRQDQGLLDRVVAQLNLWPNGDELLDERVRAFLAAHALHNSTDAAALAAVQASADMLLERGALEDAERCLEALATAYDARQDTASAEGARARATDALLVVAERLPPALKVSYLSLPRRRRLFPDIVPQARVSGEHNPAPPARLAPPPARTIAWDTRYPRIIGTAPSLLRVFDRLDRVLRGAPSTVLVRGESGTGKELIASAVHEHGARPQGPFVRVNCAALVETLLMSELFGHEKGSFTGALSRKIGRFEMAKGGTIFLDEIGDISPKTQVALLRVLQERTFERVGGAHTLHTDAVVVCATHRNLEQMVADGQFREDLYYRLKTVVLELPSLRERPGDIPVLAEHFLDKLHRSAKRGPTHLTAQAANVLMHYGWPGNIRELENMMRTVALFSEGEIVDTPHLSEFPELFERTIARQTPIETSWRPTVRAESGAAVHNTAPVRTPTAHAAAVKALAEHSDELGLRDLKQKLEFDAIAEALRTHRGNITHAANALRMKRPRLSQIVNGNAELKALKESVRRT